MDNSQDFLQDRDQSDPREVSNAPEGILETRSTLVGSVTDEASSPVVPTLSVDSRDLEKKEEISGSHPQPPKACTEATQEEHRAEEAQGPPKPTGLPTEATGGLNVQALPCVYCAPRFNDDNSNCSPNKWGDQMKWVHGLTTIQSCLQKHQMQMLFPADEQMRERSASSSSMSVDPTSDDDSRSTEMLSDDAYETKSHVEVFKEANRKQPKRIDKQKAPRPIDEQPLVVESVPTIVLCQGQGKENAFIQPVNRGNTSRTTSPLSPLSPRSPSSLSPLCLSPRSPRSPRQIPARRSSRSASPTKQKSGQQKLLKSEHEEEKGLVKKALVNFAITTINADGKDRKFQEQSLGIDISDTQPCKSGVKRSSSQETPFVCFIVPDHLITCTFRISMFFVRSPTLGLFPVDIQKLVPIQLTCDGSTFITSTGLSQITLPFLLPDLHDKTFNRDLKHAILCVVVEVEGTETVMYQLFEIVLTAHVPDKNSSLHK